MKILDYIKNNILFLDGGLGTLLQERGLPAGELPERWNLSHPEVICDVHRKYFDAGSHVVATNTFGANLLKFSKDELEAIAAAAMANARAARDASINPREKFIAFDIGPTGKLLKPYGDLDFEDAVSIFAENARLAERYGADLVLIETMSDSYETKAALLAVKENCSLPVFVSNAYGSDGRLLTGATPQTMAVMLEALGADAIGANCSQGPAALAKVALELAANTSLPVFIKPNAGLPTVRDGKTCFDVSPEDFARELSDVARRGISILGGCCGTTPEHIGALCRACKDIPFSAPVEKDETVICSYTNALRFGSRPLLIGERINPTGKKLFKEALRSHDLDYILKEGLDQEEAGADALDVNVGLPDIDERSMLCETVCALQAVTALPLQIDTANPSAMEDALRRYNGKALINSVNGAQSSMNAVFPLVKKYGGVVIALTLDENGIPDTVDGRIAIARRILECAKSYGIKKKDIIFDTLTMTVSAEPRAAAITLEALRRIRQELQAHTVLGVSNVSFGLPERDVLNAAFFTCAMENGLSAAIMNPFSLEMMKAYRAFCALHSLDPNCSEYIKLAELIPSATGAQIPRTSPSKTGESADMSLSAAIEQGLSDRARAIASELLSTCDPLSIVNGHVIPALDKVGRGFEEKKVYLPSLLMAAEAARAAVEPISAALSSARSSDKKMTVVLATVKGDVHDIGKNIVKLLMDNYGFNVVDLGKDVPPEAVLEAARANGAALVGLSALMTTTVPAMEETVRLLHKELPLCKVMVGGAVLNEEFAAKIGADHYAPDAMDGVRYAESLI